MVEKILAIDFGFSKMGLAIGNIQMKSSTALGILRAKNGVPIWDDLDKVIHQWKPKMLLIGYPINMDGTESTMSKLVEEFAESLNNRYSIDYELIDERLSSFEAKGILIGQYHLNNTFNRKRQKKQKKQKRQKKYNLQEVDSIAASILLDNWFSNQ